MKNTSVDVDIQKDVSNLKLNNNEIIKITAQKGKYMDSKIIYIKINNIFPFKSSYLKTISTYHSLKTKSAK